MLKKLFTYSLSLWLSVSVLLASAGVPVFAHYCNMNADCLEMSVLPVESCCDSTADKEQSADGCSEKSSCCNDELSFIKDDLPAALKNVNSNNSLVPAVLFIILPYATTSKIIKQSCYLPSSNNAPPLLSGRDLLTEIRVFRI